jgi:amyloid beta A4 protein
VHRYPELNVKILPLMEDYLVALRSRDNTPAPLLTMDREHEEQMIDNFRAEVEAKLRLHQEQEQQQEAAAATTESPAAATEVKEEITAAEGGEGTTAAATGSHEEATADETTLPAEDLAAAAAGENTLKVEVHATAVHHHVEETPRVAHAQTHDFSHNQGAYTVRRVEMGGSGGGRGGLIVTLIFGGVAIMIAMVVGVVLVRQRGSRYAQQQLVSKIGGRTRDGFIEVDAATPEERHMAAMQITGYENPTYKYFEASTA